MRILSGYSFEQNLPYPNDAAQRAASHAAKLAIPLIVVVPKLAHPCGAMEAATDIAIWLVAQTLDGLLVTCELVVQVS
jgi:hypothetical protein